MKLAPLAIRRQREEITRKRLELKKKHDAEMAELDRELNKLQKECKHPDPRIDSFSDGPWKYCPDCSCMLGQVGSTAWE